MKDLYTYMFYNILKAKNMYGIGWEKSFGI